jgi:predicted Zn-dependent peptidase
VESTPLGKYDEEFDALFWEASPYRWPILGWASDIPNYTLAQAKQYFGTYYAPNNITGVLAGDFKPAEVMPTLERYFGRIPRGTVEPPPVVTHEPKQLGEKRYNAEAETSPTVRVWWKTVPLLHKDTAPLDLLQDILSGRTGRLYKGLVLGRKVANQSSADHESLKYDGIFKIETTVKDGVEPAAAEAATYEEIGSLQKDEVPAPELQKVKNAYKANAYRRLSSPFFVGLQLISYDALGDWRLINTAPERADAVNAADIRRVAREYLGKETRTVATFRRKEGAPPEDPEIAKLPPKAQAMVRQASEQIAAETDPAKLRERVDEMQQMSAQVPAEMKPAFDIILKRATERLQALSAGKK